MKTFLLNAFSLQMVDVPCSVHFSEVDVLPEGLTSAIGHQDTANVLGVPMNRVNVSLKVGDTAYVAQLQGGRLPEGSTTLPEGFRFKFIKVEILPSAEDLPIQLDWIYSMLNPVDGNIRFTEEQRKAAMDILRNAMLLLH